MPTEVLTEQQKNRQTRARLVLIGIFTLFFVPVFGAVVIAVVAPHWVPFGRVNNGELVQPPIADVLLNLSPLDAEPAYKPGPETPWVIAHVGPASCDVRCEYALVRMRQARLALGKDAHRVQRWWLVTESISPGQVTTMMQSYPGLRIGLLRPRTPLAAHTFATIAVQMIDPAGFLILQYPNNWQDKELATQGATGLAGALLKDLKRLLKISKRP
ncbi:MAG: hypothetical protein ACI8W7_000045 [Gammaproteobacteria bacterium]|jgi:hypothetical protein